MTKGKCLNMGLFVNLNDPKSIDEAFSYVARTMLEQDEKACRMTGLFMKAQAGALAASMADMVRQYGDDPDFSCGDILHAALNCWAQMFGIMLTQAVKSGHEPEAVQDAATAFGTVVSSMVKAAVTGKPPEDFESVECPGQPEPRHMH